MIGAMFMQNGDVVKKTWILLETFSTDSVTNNLDYVEDVKNFTKDKYLTVSTNGGLLLFDRKGRLIFLPLSVHVNRNYLAKILSLKYVKNIAGVKVIMSDGTVFKFKECGLGLYHYDMSSNYDQNSAKTNAEINPYSLLSTVTDNK